MINFVPNQITQLKQKKKLYTKKTMFYPICILLLFLDERDTIELLLTTFSKYFIDLPKTG